MYHLARGAEIQTYAAGLTDFFLAPPENLTYGKFNTMAHPYEHSLFPGITVFVFVIAGFWLFLRRKFSARDRPHVVAYMTILVLAVVCTTGPVYGLLYGLPGGETLRVPTRFMVIVLFASSILAAYVWKSVGKFRFRRLLFIFVIAALCFEYRYDFGRPMAVPQPVQQFYRTLNGRKDVHVLLELPMGNGYSTQNPVLDRDFMADSKYLLFALYHNKILLNGYSGFIPPDWFLLGRTLALDFPTKEKIIQLEHIGVDTVVVHLDEYADVRIGAKVLSGLRSIGLTEIGHTKEIFAFRLTLSL